MRSIILVAMLLATAAPVSAKVYSGLAIDRTLQAAGGENRDLIDLWGTKPDGSCCRPVAVSLRTAEARPVTVIAYNYYQEEIARASALTGEVDLTIDLAPHGRGYLRVVPTGGTYDTPVGSKFRRSVKAIPGDTAVLPAYRMAFVDANGQQMAASSYKGAETGVTRPAGATGATGSLASPEGTESALLAQCGSTRPQRSDVDTATKAAAKLPQFNMAAVDQLAARWGILAALAGHELATADGSTVFSFAWAPGLEGYKLNIAILQPWTKKEPLSREREIVWDGTKLITKLNQFGWDKPAASCVAILSDGTTIYQAESLQGGKIPPSVWRATDAGITLGGGEETILVRTPGARRSLLARYEKPKSSGSGGGIGGMLAGALLGGALTGGSAEGILAGARALAGSDSARAALDEQAAALAETNRQQAEDDANFQARIAGIVNQGSSGQSPAASSASGPSPSPRAQALPSQAIVEPGVSSPKMISTPLRFMLAAGVAKVMGPKGSEVQGRCFSNVLTIAGPPAPDGNVNAWGMLEKYYTAINPFVERFKSLCSAAGPVDEWDVVWDIESGDDPDQEYAANRARGVWHEVRL